MKEPVASYKIIDVGEKFLEDSAITRLRLLLNCRFNLNKVLIVEYLSRSFQFELLVFFTFLLLLSLSVVCCLYLLNAY